MTYYVFLLAVLGSQGIVVKCAAAIFFCTLDSLITRNSCAYCDLSVKNKNECRLHVIS